MGHPIKCQLETAVCNKQCCQHRAADRKHGWHAGQRQGASRIHKHHKPLSSSKAACTPQHRGLQSQTCAGEPNALLATSAPAPDKLVPINNMLVKQVVIHNSLNKPSSTNKRSHMLMARQGMLEGASAPTPWGTGWTGGRRSLRPPTRQQYTAQDQSGRMHTRKSGLKASSAPPHQHIARSTSCHT